jgi:hypothetical protein
LRVAGEDVGLQMSEGLPAASGPCAVDMHASELVEFADFGVDFDF